MKYEITPLGKRFLWGVFFMYLPAYLINHSMFFFLGTVFLSTFIYHYLAIRLLFVAPTFEWFPPSEVFAQQAFQLEAAVRFPSKYARWLRFWRFELQEQHGLAASPAVLEQVPASGSGKIHFKLEAKARGFLTLGSLSVQCAHPFGFVRATCTVDRPFRMLVYPRLVVVPPKPEGHLHSIRGLTEHRALEDYDYLGAYRDGDDVRLIHWKKSATQQVPVIRRALRQMDMGQPSLFVPDRDCEDLESAIALAAALALADLGRRHWAIWQENGLIECYGRDQVLATFALLESVNSFPSEAILQAERFSPIFASDLVGPKDAARDASSPLASTGVEVG